MHWSYVFLALTHWYGITRPQWVNPMLCSYLPLSLTKLHIPPDEIFLLLFAVLAPHDGEVPEPHGVPVEILQYVVGTQQQLQPQDVQDGRLPVATPANNKEFEFRFILLVNFLRHGDTIRHRRFWSTLVQIMACCLMAPSHYLNQCRLIIH